MKNSEQAMATTNKGANRYVYRSRRDNGQVRRDYLGTLDDPVTRIIVRADELGRATRHAATEEAELDTYARVEPCIRLVATESSRLVRQLRYQHRRTRGSIEGESRIDREEWTVRKMMDRQLKIVDIDRDSFDALIDQAASGNEDAIEDLRRALRGNPGIYQVLGDLGRHVQMSLIDIAAPDSAAVRESLKLTMDELRDDWLRDGSSALEKLLIEQVVTTLIDASIQQIGFSQPHAKATIKRRWERQLDRAQKRHRAAVQALVEVKNMITSQQ